MRPIVTSLTLIAAVANGVALSQSLGAAGALTLNGSLVTAGVATFDAPRRVIITSAGNDSGITWTVTGTARPEQGGAKLVETIKGANIGVAQTTQDFATVTSIAGSGATASTVTAGTDGVGSGPWVPWSRFMQDFQVEIVGEVTSGSPVWGVEFTADDGWNLPAGVSFPRPIQHPVLAGEAATAYGSIDFPVWASRLTMTTVGGVQLTQTQQGV